MKCFETGHEPCDPPDKAMDLLNDIVEVFGLNDTDDPTNSREFEDNIEALQIIQICTAFVDGNAIWYTLWVHCALEEP